MDLCAIKFDQGRDLTYIKSGMARVSALICWQT